MAKFNFTPYNEYESEIIAEFEVVETFQKLNSKKRRTNRQWTQQEKVKHSRRTARKNKEFFI